MRSSIGGVEGSLSDATQNGVSIMRWTQLTVATSQEAVDAVSNYLFELNANGIEVKEDSTSPQSAVKLISYFRTDDVDSDRVQAVQKFLAQLPEIGMNPHPAEVWLSDVEEEDWSAKWRSGFQPRRIGKRLVIAPTWHELTPNESEILIRLDPGMAFGTGHHPTTQVSMELLEKVIRKGDIAADIGTGTGILSIAAAKLGAARVDAVDIDGKVMPVASENLLRNGVEPIVHLKQGDGLNALCGTYHLIISNTLSEVILPMIPHCPQFLKSEGKVVLSGIMGKEAGEIEIVLRANGFQCIEIQEQDCWVGIAAMKL